MSKIRHNGVNCCIKLPNGNQLPTDQVGDVQLSNDLVLHNTLVVPDFKYNLMSVSKLCKDNKCLAVFGEDLCLLQDCAIRQLKGIGECRDGLYYLVNSPLKTISPALLNK